MTTTFEDRVYDEITTLYSDYLIKCSNGINKNKVNPEDVVCFDDFSHNHYQDVVSNMTLDRLQKKAA